MPPAGGGFIAVCDGLMPLPAATVRLFFATEAAVGCRSLFIPGTGLVFLSPLPAFFSSADLSVLDPLTGLDDFVPEDGEGFVPKDGEGCVPKDGEGFVPEDGEGFVPEDGEGFVPENGEGFLSEDGEGFGPDGFNPGAGDDFIEGDGEDFDPEAGEGFASTVEELESEHNDVFEADLDSELLDSDSWDIEELDLTSSSEIETTCSLTVLSFSILVSLEVKQANN